GPDPRLSQRSHLAAPDRAPCPTRRSSDLPREIANKLAADIDTIALPVIMNSPVLTDADLVEIIRACPPSKQVAVASRESLSTKRSEEHTSELQSRENLVCRLPLEKKKTLP